MDAKLLLRIKSGQSPYLAEPVTAPGSGNVEAHLLTEKHSFPNPRET